MAVIFSWPGGLRGGLLKVDDRSACNLWGVFGVSTQGYTIRMTLAASVGQQYKAISRQRDDRGGRRIAIRGAA